MGFDAKDAKYREEGTPVSGYAENGPYHCEDCVHLEGRVCAHPVVMADPGVKKKRDADGRPYVNVEHGCCRFVRQIKPAGKFE